MTLRDYVRLRRLSLAALELRQGGGPVTQITQKYGYASHSAFSRAFRELHGTAPSQARSTGAALQIMPPFKFHNPLPVTPGVTYRVEEGALKIAGVAGVSFMEFGPYRFIGKQIRTSPMSNNIACFWGECFLDGTFDTLFAMQEHLPDAIKPEFTGCQRDFDPVPHTFTYMAGLFMNADAPVPEGFAAFDVPRCTLANCWVRGEEYELYANAHPLTVEAIRSQIAPCPAVCPRSIKAGGFYAAWQFSPKRSVPGRTRPGTLRITGRGSERHTRFRPPPGPNPDTSKGGYASPAVSAQTRGRLLDRLPIRQNRQRIRRF